MFTQSFSLPRRRTRKTEIVFEEKPTEPTRCGCGIVVAWGFAAFALKQPIVLYVLPSGRRSRFLLHRKHKAFVGSWCVEGTRTRLCEIRRTSSAARCVPTREAGFLLNVWAGRRPLLAAACWVFLGFYFPGLTSDQSGKLSFLKNWEAFVRDWLCKVTL